MIFALKNKKSHAKWFSVYQVRFSDLSFCQFEGGDLLCFSVIIIVNGDNDDADDCVFDDANDNGNDDNNVALNNDCYKKC